MGVESDFCLFALRAKRDIAADSTMPESLPAFYIFTSFDKK
jgi:hypothetical protein